MVALWSSAIICFVEDAQPLGFVGNSQPLKGNAQPLQYTK